MAAIPNSTSFESVQTGTIEFPDPENIGLDTKIVILGDLEVEIYPLKGFGMAAILKIQNGSHNALRRRGTCQKMNTIAMSNT